MSTRMGSSTDSSSTAAGDRLEGPLSCEGISDPRLQAALLRHPSMQCWLSHDRQLVASLLQTSKELQAAVAQHGAGQLQPEVVQPRTLQSAEGLARWMQKHGSLLHELAVDLTIKQSPQHMESSSSRIRKHWAAAAASCLGAGMQQAVAAAGALQLQSFSLIGAPAGPAAVLQQLPAAQLTRLHVEADLFDSNSMQAIAALSDLRSLELHCSCPQTAINVPYFGLKFSTPFTESGQLTYLQLGPIGPWNLSCLEQLPRRLQQLHLTVAICFGFQELFVLADWLKQHATALSSLKVEMAADFDYCIIDDCPEQFTEETDGVRAVAAALQEAALLAEAAEAAEAEAAEAAPPEPAAQVATAPTAEAAAQSSAGQPTGLQLQSFTLDFAAVIHTPAAANAALPLLQSLPASSLTQLQCQVTWGDNAQVSALCSLTALQSCVLSPAITVLWFGIGVLSQLSALQQLTRLELTVTQRWLQQLPQLPQLQVLQVLISGNVPGQQLELGHLTSLTQMVLVDWQTPLLAADQLPPNLRQLVWLQQVKGQTSPVNCSHSLQPLLALRHLQKLHLQMPGALSAAAELTQLSSMSSLQEIGLCCAQHAASGFDSSVARAWGRLPLKSLEVGVEVSAAFVQQLTMLNGLTCLCLNRVLGPASGRTLSTAVTPAQLAAVVAQLTQLQLLTLKSGMQADRNGSTGGVTSYFEGVAALLQAVGGLQQLGSVHVRLPLELDGAAVQQLSGMLGQLLPSSLAACCEVRTDLLSIRT